MSNTRKNTNRRQAPSGSRRRPTNKKMKRSRKIGIILADIQLVLTFVFSGLLLLLNILPLKYLLVVILVLLFFVGYAFLSQLTRRYRTLGKVVSIFTSIVLVFGSYYLIETQSMLSNISGSEIKLDEMSILVLKDDSAETINDAIDYTFGINETIHRDNTNETIDNINDELDTQVQLKEYSSYEPLVEGLFNEEVGVIIINEAYREIIHESYPDFDERTRILANYEVESIVNIPSESEKEITKEAFVVYISGIDTAGSISKTSRSDVNIIATINPNTKQILLTTTPRDYYVPFPISGGMRDKLTHAGIYGIDVSIGALEDLYDIDIDYYARVNFDTLINLVDALGGVTVYSEYSFNAGGYSFTKGDNQMDGKKALAFSRERSSFKAGDNQRGKNQMQVIKGIINKAISPAIITNYGSVMDSISGSFETNMSNNEITSLIKMQIDDMTPWNIVTNNVIGTNARKTSYTYKTRSLSVIVPNEESIEEAKQKMAQVVAGTIVTQD